MWSIFSVYSIPVQQNFIDVSMAQLSISNIHENVMNTNQSEGINNFAITDFMQMSYEIYVYSKGLNGGEMVLW